MALQRFSAWQHLASMRCCSQPESAENTLRFQDDPPALVADASRGRDGGDRADISEVPRSRRQSGNLTVNSGFMGRKFTCWICEQRLRVQSVHVRHWICIKRPSQNKMSIIGSF